MPLLEGTLITLKDKSEKKIEELKINDELITFSIDGLENIQNMDILKEQELLTFNGSFKESKIKNIWLGVSNKIYKINDSLSIDESHYIFIKRDDKYMWVKAKDCIEGDSLFKIDNEWTEITKIEVTYEETNEEKDEGRDVYNVQMNRVYNYFASGYLVHNGDPCDACGEDCGSGSGDDY